MNFRLLAFLVVITVLRLVYIAQVGLMPDEAYYHEWSQRLDWWYFSKGPGIALIIRAGTALFGHTEFGIRFFAPLFGLGTSLLMYWLAKRIYDARVAFWTVIVMSVTPLFNAGSLLMTIDGPSIFFWTASLCTLWLALEKSPASSKWWILTGLLTGLGFLCKMTNAAFFASAFLLILMTARYRGELIGRGFWSMLLVFAPFTVPFVMWNRERGWPTTTHLAARGGLDAPWWDFDFKAFAEFVGAHFLVYSPLIFFTMLMALGATTGPSFQRWTRATTRAVLAFPASLRSSWLGWLMLAVLMLGLWMAGNFFESTLPLRIGKWLLVLVALAFIAARKEAANVNWKPRFLAAFALPLLLAYVWISLHHKCEPNWTAPASVSLCILTVAYALDRVAKKIRGARGFSIAALSLGAVLSVIAINSNILRAAGIPLPWGRDPSSRMQGWREVAERVGAFRDSFEKETGRKTFLIANSYGTAAELCFYLPEKRIEVPGHPAVYVPESPVAENQFHFWGRYDEYEARTAPLGDEQADTIEYGMNRFEGRTAIYVTDRPLETVPMPELCMQPPEEFWTILSLSTPAASWVSMKKPEGVWLMRTFDRWELKTTFEFSSRGLPLRTIRVFLCHRYRPGKMLD